MKTELKYYVKETAGKFTSMALGNDGNYSIASDADPEPSGYTNHVWGKDVAEWREVDAETIRRLGHHNVPE